MANIQLELTPSFVTVFGERSGFSPHSKTAPNPYATLQDRGRSLTGC